MEYLINRIDPTKDFTKDKAKVIYSDNGMTVDCFYLKKCTSLMESLEEPSDKDVGRKTICYIVERGCLEFWLGEEKITISQGDCITVLPEENFSIWALEDSVLLAIHNRIEPDFDNTPTELVEAVTKVELKDSYLQGHNYRVGKYSMLMMQIMCPEAANSTYYLSAAYHDVGKVVVPEQILNKTEKLSDEEFEEIKKHPAASYDMLKNYLGGKTANYARWHHEKLDGTGYPDGIKGDQIPLGSRIMAVADIFDALTTARCYRKAFTFEKALEIMQSDVAKGKIDGEVFSVLLRLVREGRIVDGVDNQVALSPKQDMK